MQNLNSKLVQLSTMTAPLHLLEARGAIEVDVALVGDVHGVLDEPSKDRRCDGHLRPDLLLKIQLHGPADAFHRLHCLLSRPVGLGLSHRTVLKDRPQS